MASSSRNCGKAKACFYGKEKLSKFVKLLSLLGFSSRFDTADWFVECPCAVSMGHCNFLTLEWPGLSDLSLLCEKDQRVLHDFSPHFPSFQINTPPFQLEDLTSFQHPAGPISKTIPKTILRIAPSYHPKDKNHQQPPHLFDPFSRPLSTPYPSNCPLPSFPKPQLINIH